MNCTKVMLIMLSCCLSVTANQANIARVCKVTAPVKTETVHQDEFGDNDLDNFVDFETEGEIDLKEMKPSKIILLLSQLVAPFFEFYNWLHKDAYLEK